MDCLGRKKQNPHKIVSLNTVNYICPDLYFMIEIKFPDNSTRNFETGTTVLEVAKSISEGLARNVLSAQFNKQTVETATPLIKDGEIELFTWNNERGKAAFWHSSAHVLAQAILALYPDAKLTIGPAIENGFYYDADFGNHSITEKELKDLENKFLEFARQKFEFKIRKASKQEALDFYKKDENPYKIELIENLLYFHHRP